MAEKHPLPATAKIATAFYRLAVAGWLGGAALFTFILTPTLFGALNRDQAGAIVGHLFPGYFRWGLACGVIALAALALSAQVNRRRLAAFALVGMLGIAVVQAFVIEPKAAALKQQIPSFETTSPDHPLRREFRKLHGISALANLVVIGGGVFLVVML
ncbi:MAG: DUF4149 domain-containing protein [Desulfobulbaceae bacterium]|nr:DUF4149 domain-containing protein [Desulfobulbaceae bacterium]